VKQKESPKQLNFLVRLLLHAVGEPNISQPHLITCYIAYSGLHWFFVDHLRQNHIVAVQVSKKTTASLTFLPSHLKYDLKTLVTISDTKLTDSR